MNTIELHRVEGLKGDITVPPDKSISHRAMMFASIAEGRSIIRNFLRAEDPISTMNAMKSLGIEIYEGADDELIINGKGLNGLTEPFDVIDCGNSGTTIRLLSGILGGNTFLSVLTGDESLRQRPMARIIRPLREMGADISGRAGDKFPPLAIKSSTLNAIDYKMPVASAQVKSCLILAGLYADGVTTVTEPYKSRDHTELMLKSMGAGIEVAGNTVKVKGGVGLNAIDITVPSDFSSAAFFIAAAQIIPDSEILIKGVGINPTRTGFLSVIEDMGGAVELRNIREVSGEPVADIYCETAESLEAIRISEDSMPSLIDEFPVLCVLASQANGVTEIRGARELRLKESDRISAMATELRKMGITLEEYPDGLSIEGPAELRGSAVESYGDHRIAMALSVAGLIAEGKTIIDNPSCVDISFPGFFDILESLSD